MTSLTERYLAATLQAIPEGKRADVERELRSSIADAVEDRVAAGEDPVAAETAVLEGLGNPAHLAAGITGRPMYLIGPELFPVYRRLLALLLSIVVPIVGVVQAAVELGGGGSWADAVGAGIGGMFAAAIQVALWATLGYAILERVDPESWQKQEMKELREGLRIATPWTVANLPDVPPAGRVGPGETIGEIVTLAISIGGLLVLRGVSSFADAGERGIPLLQPDVVNLWIPALIAILGALVAFEIVKLWTGGWTTTLAVVHTVLQTAFSGPVIVLALTGSIINPAFAEEIGWPPLAEATGPVMLALAAVALLVTAWEIVDGFRRARQPRLQMDHAT
jgi:hypothetical protein